MAIAFVYFVRLVVGGFCSESGIIRGRAGGEVCSKGRNILLGM